MNIHELSDRLERLESENRRMKRAGFFVIAAALAVALVGAAKPEKIPEVVDARMFRVIDDNGQVRAGMAAKAISYYDENGQGRAYLSANAIGYTDANGKERAAMDANGVWYYDQTGRTRATMNAAGFAYADEKGTTRANLGAFETIDPTSGEKTRYPTGVALFDEAGNKVWRAPE